MAETHANREARERGELKSGVCPVHGVACATAYHDAELRCRCDACRAAESARRSKVPAEGGVAELAVQDAGGDEVIFELVADGRTLESISDELGISRYALAQYLGAEERLQEYRAAQQASAGAFAEQGLTIIDDAIETTAGVAKAKERAGYRKWLAGVRSPQEYGNKSQIALEGAGDVGAGLLAALMEYGNRDAPGIRRLQERGEIEEAEYTMVESNEDE